MRWLAPDWSIVRWVKHVIYDEDYDDEHEYKDINGHNYHHMNGVVSEIGSEVMPPEIANEN